MTPVASDSPAIPEHLLQIAMLLLAERNGQIVGFGGPQVRNGIAFLTDHFVDLAVQSSDVGKTLRRTLFAEASTHRCTLAPADACEVALYTRGGMRLCQPSLDLFRDAVWLRVPEPQNLFSRRSIRST